MKRDIIFLIGLIIIIVILLIINPWVLLGCFFGLLFIEYITKRKTIQKQNEFIADYKKYLNQIGDSLTGKNKD